MLSSLLTSTVRFLSRPPLLSPSISLLLSQTHIIPISLLFILTESNQRPPHRDPLGTSLSLFRSPSRRSLSFPSTSVRSLLKLS